MSNFFDDLSPDAGAETLPNFDYEGMRQLSNEKFAEKYCRIESQPCLTIEQTELQTRVLGILTRELKRRVIDRLIHPKAFEKMCEQAYEKLEKEAIEKAMKDGIERPNI